MSYKLEFIIQSLPKTVNAMSKTSFWARKNENKRWDKLIYIGVVGRKPIDPLKKANVTLTRVSSREPDTDGLYASMKSLIDALVNNGIIIDDKPSVINLKCLWEKGAPGKGAVRISVVEL